jgi:hypothetical protein
VGSVLCGLISRATPSEVRPAATAPSGFLPPALEQRELKEVGPLFSSKEGPLVVWNNGVRSYAVTRRPANQVDNPLISRGPDSSHWALKLGDKTLTLAIGRAYAGDNVWLQVRVEDDAQRRYPLALDPQGRLYVSASPVSSATVVNEDTGEVIDTIALRRVGQFPNPYLDRETIFRKGTFTSCSTGDRCLISLAAGVEVRAPFSGSLSCLSYSSFELVGDDVRLRFEDSRATLDPASMSAEPLKCESRGSIARGDILLANQRSDWFWVSAFSVSGSQAPLVIGDDYAIYTGPVYLKFTDPWPSH